jgi:hypothetical protein
MRKRLTYQVINEHEGAYALHNNVIYRISKAKRACLCNLGGSPRSKRSITPDIQGQEERISK